MATAIKPRGILMPDETPLSDSPSMDGLGVPASAWTLDEAFSILREALAAHYEAADNMPAYLGCQEKQMLFANGNAKVAWQHLIVLLEQAIGVPLRTS